MDLVKANQLLDALRDEINKTDPLPPESGVRHVKVGEDLQAVLDNLNGATEVRLQPGNYSGNFILRKHNNPLVTICADAEVPLARVTPSNSANMARFLPKNAFNPELTMDDGVKNYCLRGLEFLPNTVAPDRDLVVLGRLNMNAAEQIPDNVKVDRCYFHGHEQLGGHRGLMFNVTHGVVSQCYFEKFIEKGRDSQAVAICLGGPYNIVDNYMEASGENLIFGGSDPKIPSEMPRNVVVQNNYFFKPLEWKTQFPSSVKNLFEIKNGSNFVISGNRFENCWTDAQSGHGVVITIRNQNNTAPWSTINNVLFKNNVILGVTGFAVNTLGLDDTNPSVRGFGIQFFNNWMKAKGGIIVNNGFLQMECKHNTFEVTNSILSFTGLDDITGLRFIDNVANSGAYGIVGAKNLQVGKPNLDAYNPQGYEFKNNVIEKTAERNIQWPDGNFLLAPNTLASLLVNGEYRGQEMSTDGKKLGYNASSPV